MNKILHLFVITCIYILNTNYLYSKEEPTNTSNNEISSNEININGVKYAPVSPNPSTPPNNSTQTNPKLDISDFIVGGYVSAGYIVNMGSTHNSRITFYKYRDPNSYDPSDSRREELSTDSKSGNAFYVKLGYQSIMLGVEAELKTESGLSNTFESQIDPKYNVKIYNNNQEFGLNFYLDFLSAKDYVLAPVFGVSATSYAVQTLSDNKNYSDSYYPSLGVKYGILYRQFVYKNFGFEASWYGMSRFSNNKVQGWQYISDEHKKLISDFHNLELSFGLVYDF